MMSYFQWAEQKTKRAPARTEHNVEIIDLPDIMVTEHRQEDTQYPRHDWAYCPCVMCRSDRGEE